MLHLGNVPASSTLYIPFATYDSNGASVTMTGLAVTDIEIYKNGSVTQRASDAGYTLLDTDGIDFDGITGIHGFSVDLSDNTDAGFFAVGSFYWVVVSSVTVSAQTVNFIAATFRIVAAESVTGKPKVDVDAFGGTAGTFSGGRPEVNTTHAAGAAWASGAITAASIAADAITAAKIATGAIDADALAADAVAEIATGIWTDTVAGDFTVAASVGKSIMNGVALGTGLTVAAVSGAVGSVTGNVGGNVTGSIGSVAVGGITTTSFAAGAIDAAAIAADAIGSSELAATATAEIADAVLLRKLDRSGNGTDALDERTVVNALRALRNKQSIAAGTLTVTKEDDTTTAWTAAITTTAGDPISTIDPT